MSLISKVFLNLNNPNFLFPFLLINVEGREITLWRGKAIRRAGHIKIAGTLLVTNYGIKFMPLLGKDMISIELGKIEEVNSYGKWRKKLRIKGVDEYIFQIKNAEEVGRLIKTLLHHPQHL